MASIGLRHGAVAHGASVTIYELGAGEASEGATVSVSAAVEHVAWSSTGQYAVAADANGGLNFVLESGKVLFRHALVKPEPGAPKRQCFSSRIS